MGQNCCQGYQDSQLGCFGPFVNLGFNVTAVGLLIAGLMLNQLNDIYDDQSSSEPDRFCGWNSIWQDEEVHLAEQYRYYCNNEESVPEGELSSDYCQTQSCGQAYVILAVGSVILGISASLISLTTMVKYDDGYDQGCSVCKKFLELFCTIFTVASIVGWFFNNDICWNEEDQANELTAIGGTIIFLGCAAGCFLIACIVRFI